MTPEEARIIVLEQELDQAANTIEFLHGCLTDPVYKYSYPDHTTHRLAKIRELVPDSPRCVHSVTRDRCEGCINRVERMLKLNEARAVLGL